MYYDRVQFVLLVGRVKEEEGESVDPQQVCRNFIFIMTCIRERETLKTNVKITALRY